MGAALLPCPSKGITVWGQKKKQAEPAHAKEVEVEGQTVARPFLIKHRKAAKAVVLAFAALALAVPLLVVGLSAGHFAGGKVPAIRLLGLYAFTFAFFNIMTGALAPRFYMVFNPAREYLFHIVSGTLTLAFAVAHGTTVLATTFYRGFSAFWIIGPVALGLLVITVVTALEKNRLAHVWRAVHILNYLIFLAIFIKAMIIGTDVSAATATAELMKSVMILYVVLAAAATTLRVIDRRKIAARRRRAAETAP